MNKNFSYYLKIWVILFVLFNAIVFALPVRYNGWYKFGGAFWSGYIFVIISFIIQIFISYISFKEIDKEKLIYKIPLVSKSFKILVLIIVFESICMFYPDTKQLIGVLVGIALMAVGAILIINADKAGMDIVENEEKVKSNTYFVKEISLEIELLMNKADDEKTKELYKSVFETLRYSDPVSSYQTKGIEGKIVNEINDLKNDVNSIDKINNLLSLINERNIECKKYK